MNDRMSWEEIQKMYPDQWIGLTDVEYIDNDGISIKSGIVKYTDKPKGELTHLMLNGEIVSRYTTPDSAFQLGMIGIHK